MHIPIRPAHEEPTPRIFFLLFCEAAGWRRMAQFWEEDETHPRWICRLVFHTADIAQSVFSHLWDWKIKPNY